MSREDLLRSPALAPTMLDSTGQAQLVTTPQFGRYAILSLLGEGGMGAVYLALDTQLDRRVALKVLRAGEVSDHAKSRMTREAQLMAKLAHPNIVTVHDAGEIDGQAFIAMELVDGQTLSKWLEAPRTLVEILDAFQFCGQALARAHEVGVVHRDFKPDNVLVDRTGRILVTDFGIATARGSDDVAPSAPPGSAPAPSSPSLTRTGTLIGTPAYMSPEQLRGLRVNAASDQFSFAVSLYEALYRQPPFAGETFEELRVAVLGGKFLPLPRDARKGIPDRIHAALLRALSRPPTQRFPDMPALLAELVPPAERRGLVLGGIVGALAVVGIAAATFAIVRARPAGTAVTSEPAAVAVASTPSLVIGAPTKPLSKKHDAMEYPFTATVTAADGTKRDVTKDARWAMTTDAPAMGKIESEGSRPGHATFQGGGIYRVTATLGELTTTTNVEVRTDYFQAGVISSDADHATLVDGVKVRFVVAAHDHFVTAGEHHAYGVHVNLPAEGKSKRTVVQLGYQRNGENEPALPYFLVENHPKHRFTEHPLTVGKGYTFTLVASGNDWEASMEPDGAPAIVLDHATLPTAHAEMPFVVIEIGESEDVCHAGTDMVSEAPSIRVGTHWRALTHLRAIEMHARCPIRATTPGAPRFELRMPSDEGCIACAVF